ncbi:MAG: hypothetical protein ACE5D7_05355, partial [Fidelibacterota bacterium]
KVFIRQNWNLNWKKMNRKFDDHILTFLYHRYNLNKKELSENLGVNYSRLVVRFKQIESSWYGSIPNISTNKIESN